jgi:hypothetical protein
MAAEPGNMHRELLPDFNRGASVTETGHKKIHTATTPDGFDRNPLGKRGTTKTILKESNSGFAKIATALANLECIPDFIGLNLYQRWFAALLPLANTLH